MTPETPGATRRRLCARLIGLPLRSTADVGQEVAAVHQLHREEPAILDGKELVEVHEVGMRDVAERAELLLEPDQ